MVYEPGGEGKRNKIIKEPPTNPKKVHKEDGEAEPVFKTVIEEEKK